MSHKILVLTFCSFLSLASPQSVPNVCFCATSGYCSGTGGTGSGSVDGSGSIDVRIQTNGQTSGTIGTTAQLTSPASSGITYIVNSQTFCQSGLDRCCPAAGYQCGMRYPAVTNSRQPAFGSGQTYYGAYPWLAMILRQADQAFIATGALIDQLHVITAAHKLSSSLSSGTSLVVQLGKWDGASEVFPVQTYSVTRIFIHPSFNSANLQNNVCILRMATPAPLGQFPTIGTICLPTNFVSNIRCMVVGYGSSVLGGSPVSNLQKEVDVPLVDSTTCQNLLRTTRLSQSFVLDPTSFICAGGEFGKDACTGDGGAPLMCPINNQWYLVGMVAWGIGCGQSNIPGVYVNVPSYIAWIQQTTRSF